MEGPLRANGKGQGQKCVAKTDGAKPNAHTLKRVAEPSAHALKRATAHASSAKSTPHIMKQVIKHRETVDASTHPQPRARSTAAAAPEPASAGATAAVAPVLASNDPVKPAASNTNDDAFNELESHTKVLSAEYYKKDQEYH